jgi:hypothetical protein
MAVGMIAKEDATIRAALAQPQKGRLLDQKGSSTVKQPINPDRAFYIL